MKMNENMEQKGILDCNTAELKNYLNNGSLVVSVIGLGRIGLPTALSFANSGLETIGVDINTNLVDKILSGEYPLKDEPFFDEIFEKVIKNKKFQAVTGISQIASKTDIVILALPTPMDDSNIPDYSALISVGKSLGKLNSKKLLIIVESTVEPNFIENELLSAIESSGNKKSGIDFQLAVCPETANPGEIMNDFKKLPRLVGAIDDKIIKTVSEIYSHVFSVELIPMPNCRTANAVKLTTNVFRDVNIAFVNELALLFEKLGIDTQTVIEAAKRKYNFQAHFPGAGVGGPCLPVNSYQYLNSSKKIDNTFLKIVKEARQINEGMPNHVVNLLVTTLTASGKSLSNSTITLLGVSYKPDVRDIQLAPSGKIIKILEEKNVKIKIFDPYFISSEVFNHKTEKSISDSLHESDGVIIITWHKEFHNLDLAILYKNLRTPIIVDCTGKIDPKYAKENGLIFTGIGRGGETLSKQ